MSYREKINEYLKKHPEIKGIQKKTFEKMAQIIDDVSAATANKKVVVIVFEDGTFTSVCGSWEAQKPVWTVFENECTPDEIYEQLYVSAETQDGCPIF